jgi:hypothetical protein
MTPRLLLENREQFAFSPRLANAPFCEVCEIQKVPICLLSRFEGIFLPLIFAYVRQNLITCELLTVKPFLSGCSACRPGKCV